MCAPSLPVELEGEFRSELRESVVAATSYREVTVVREEIAGFHTCEGRGPQHAVHIHTDVHIHCTCTCAVVLADKHSN